MLDVLDLAHEFDLTVPDFQGRKLCQAMHPAAIGLDRGRRDRPRPLFREVRRQGGDSDARRQPLEVCGEIHTGQGLVEIVDVKQNVLFRGVEALAATLTSIRELVV